MSQTTLFRIDPSRNPILANLQDDAASLLISKGVRNNYKAGEVLVREGAPSDFLMFVMSGEVAIYKGDVEIDRQPAGGVLGEMGVLTNQKRTATVKALTDLVVWEVQAADFLAVLDLYPQATRSMLAALVKKFEASQGRRVEQASSLQRATDILSRCISPEVVQTVLNHRTPDELLEGSVEEAAILFIDIKGFSSHAENLPARRLLNALNEHLEVIIRSVNLHQGTIVNFIGDAVLAVFNTPVPLSRPAVAAVNCYLQCIYELREMHARRRSRDAVCFDIGAGLNFGSVVAGAIGSQTRFTYSVLGDEVNLAARLERLTRAYPVEVILSESCVERLSIELAERCLLFDRVRVKGRGKPVSLYTLTELGPKDREAFDQARKLYLKGEFAAARKAFAKQPGAMAKFLAKRCAQLAKVRGLKWEGCYSWVTKE
ncbi:MAG: cyclic nucleotide-binding domain-containing protein [Verrucomicrobia bacterium]|nr:cyclic nucleotide-binding domain-containing protein [Verrucomicrobiota bacterium]